MFVSADTVAFHCKTALLFARPSSLASSEFKDFYIYSRGALNLAGVACPAVIFGTV
jgi:hypothetical protein